MQQKFEVGIDEAGRGPLAGPVAVGLVKVPKSFNFNKITGVADSKQVSEKNRLLVYKQALAFKKAGEIDFVVIQISAKTIDKIGISASIRQAILRGVKKLQLDSKNCFIKLDGSLKAPEEFAQETIIKGDSKEKSIGLASILAKVTRDTYMQKMHKKLPQYEFATHKGYGTKVHREAISRYGFSDIHRCSYCKNIKLL